MSRKRKPLSQLEIENSGPQVGKKSRNTIIAQNQRRAGTINRITLKNFMCHSFLEVNFINNVSIIIGRNGSGKSAILTALIVGLGGKASLTNRGNAVKGFVKVGKNSASVEIELHNGGPMGYKQKKYGSKIIIIRNITAGGSSNYKIKSDTGEVIATQIKEIHNIIISLNIQVDNPVCILNQDTSRNFLNSNNPKHKFTLFMRATKLESLADEYNKVNINRSESIRILEEKERNFRRLQDELKKLKGKIDNHKSIVNLRDRMKMIHIELLWAKVRDSEEEVIQAENEMKYWENKYSELVNNCSNRNEKIDEIKRNIYTLEHEINELKETIKIQLRPMLDIKRNLEELYNDCNQKRREKNLIYKSIESKSKDMKMLEKERSCINDNMTRMEQEKIERLRNLENMQEKIKGMEDHLQTCRNDLYQVKNDVSRKEEEERHLKSEMIQVDNQISNEKNSLNVLKRESGNTSLLQYGRDIPKVLQLIEQYKNQFTHSPKGPLGSYIKLKDKKWAVAVEGQLGSQLLNAFAVDNRNDNNLLNEIFNQVWSNGRKPMIITSKFFHQKHNIMQNLVQASSDCISLYDALEITDPIVSNCIVDQGQIERILLIPNTNRAIQLLSNQRNVPPNCRQGVTINGDKFYPDPHYKTYGSRYHKAQYLQINTKEYIIQLEQNIQILLRKKETIVNQHNTIHTEFLNEEARKNVLEDKIRKINTARTEIRRQLEELKSTAEPEVANAQLLECEIAEIKRLLNDEYTKMSHLEDEVTVVQQRITENEDKLSQLKKSNQDLEEKCMPLTAQIKELHIKQIEIRSSDEFDKKQIKQYEDKLDALRSEAFDKKSIVTQQSNEASNVGKRLVDLRQVPDIVSEITSLERSIKKIQSDTENVEEVMHKYHELHNKFKSASEIMINLNENVKELTRAAETRSRHYKLTESYFVTYIKHSFKKIMQFRQFSGCIEIDMKEKKLDLIVIPQQGSQGLTTTSNLSGGERSFSTVAFLYSLWQCMDFPFYFLDEFDVYMDKLNRTKVIDILLHHASTHPTLQFVFFTPQDVSFINDRVTILRLSDPERMHT